MGIHFVGFFRVREVATLIGDGRKGSKAPYVTEWVTALKRRYLASIRKHRFVGAASCRDQGCKSFPQSS
jgi:hypothetical protein